MKQLAVVACCILPGWAFADTQACRHPDFKQEVRCGQVERPLDPSAPNGKKIAVHYMIVPSQDKNKLADPVFLLAGGPGQSAIDVALWGAQIFHRLNLRRDLVFVDQRGTGKSAPLHCPELEDKNAALTHAQNLEAASRCVRDLESLPHGDMRFFTTTIAMQDMEAVRQMEGYAQLNLVGVSYGTRAGLEYLRLYPKQVRRLVLDGVVPPDAHLQASDAAHALQAVFDSCSHNALCSKTYPDLPAAWKTVSAQPEHMVQAVHPRTGLSVSLPIGGEQIVSMVHGSLYQGSTASALPYAITQSARGNYQPLLALSGYGALDSPADIAQGMHYSVWCAEEFLRTPPVDLNNPFSRNWDGAMRDVCSFWPRGKVDPAFYSVPKTDVPVLMTSGGLDPVTPPEHATAVAKQLGSKVKHLIVDNAGHGALNSGCMQDVLYRFIKGTDEELGKLDTKCVMPIPRAPAWLMPTTIDKQTSKQAGKQEGTQP